MKRTTLSLTATAAALAAIAGAASLSTPTDADAGAGARTASAERRPVERTTLTCPSPSHLEFAKTSYTAYTPKGAVNARASGGKAALAPARGDNGQGGTAEGKTRGRGRKGGARTGPAAGPLAALSAPGRPATATTEDSEAPALLGTADGSLAPGYTVQQTTEVSVGDGRGLLGTSCTRPGAEFWFAGASTAQQRQDYIHLTNPDATPAVVDLELRGRDGALETSSGDGLTVPAHETVSVLLSTLAPGDQDDLTVRVLARAGRVGAALEAVDSRLGGDWLPASAPPADSVVLPGLPEDTAAARLVLFAPGDDADLKVRLATPNGPITPAGHETLHVKGGMTTAVDLAKITQGEPGSLVLSPTDPDGAEPVVAGLRVLRGRGAGQEMAFLAATSPVEERASAAGSGVGGAVTTLLLTAPGTAARVRVTSSAAVGGGTPVIRTVQVKAGATLAVEPGKPEGKGAYAVTVEPLSGGPVHASRMLSRTSEGLLAFTLQPMPDDHGTVAVPAAVQDMSVLG